MSVIVQTKLFKTNQSQAVRLPKQIAFPDNIKEVEIIIVGNSRIISPKNTLWDDWFDNSCITPDFMNTRDQPEDQQRDNF
jgi:antitoxin VapB